MTRLNNRLDKIERKAAATGPTEIRVYFHPAEGADLPPEAEAMDDPVQDSATGEWMEATDRPETDIFVDLVGKPPEADPPL